MCRYVTVGVGQTFGNTQPALIPNMQVGLLVCLQLPQRSIFHCGGFVEYQHLIFWTHEISVTSGNYKRLPNKLCIEYLQYLVVAIHVELIKEVLQEEYVWVGVEISREDYLLPIAQTQQRANIFDKHIIVF